MSQKKNKYTLDFRNVNTPFEVHKEIQKGLDFPDYYGCNWSAFWDCLTDMYGELIHIEIFGLEVIEEKFSGMKVAVCANLPYYITSPVIMHLLESKLPVENITVMVQKEAAQRLCAPVGSRDAGAVTVAVDYYADAEKIFDVSAGSFMPAPKVDSSVIRLNVRKQPPIDLSDEKLFFRMVKAVFAQRRKTAANSISAGMSLPKETVYKAIEAAGYSENVRAESFTLNELASLANEIFTVTRQ